MEDTLNNMLKETTSEFMGIISKLIIQNKEIFNDMETEEELKKFFCKTLSIPDPKKPSTSGFTSNGKPIIKKPNGNAEGKCGPSSWMELDEFVKIYKEGKYCAFLAPKGTYKEKVCGAILSPERIEFCKDEHGTSVLKYRCYSCKTKKGNIEKKIGKASQTVQKDRSKNGFNVTSQPLGLDLEDDDDDEIVVPLVVLKDTTNIGDYKFIKSNKFSGLVLTGNTGNYVCIGKVVDDDGDNFKVDSSSKLESGWKKNITGDLTEGEKKFLKSLNIKIQPESKKKPVSVSDSEPETPKKSSNKKPTSDSESESPKKKPIKKSGSDSESD